MNKAGEDLVGRIRAALRILSEVDRAGHRHLIEDRFRVAGTPEQYLEITAAAYQAGLKPQEFTLLLPAAEPSAVVAQLTERAGAGSLSRGDSGAVTVLLRVDVDWTWDDLIQAIESRIASSTVFEDDEITACLSALIRLQHDGHVDEATASLKRLTSNGAIMNCLHQSQSDDDLMGMSYCVLSMLVFNPSGEQQANVGNSSSGHQAFKSLTENPNGQPQLIKSLAETARRHELINALLEQGAADTARSLIDEILRSLAGQEDFILSPEILIEHFVHLAKTFPEESFNQVIAKTDADGRLRDKLKAVPFDQQLADLYIQVRRGSGDAEFDQFLRRGLEGMDSASWLKEFNRSGGAVELALELLATETTLRLDVQEALLNHAKSVAESGRKPAKFEARWEQLLGALAPHSRETLLRDIRDEIVDHPDNSAQALLALYGKALLDAHLGEKAEELVRRSFREMIDRQDPRELEWMRDVLRERRFVYDSAPGASRTALEDRLRIALAEDPKEANEDVRELLIEIASILEVEVPEVDEGRGDDEVDEQAEDEDA